ncbi:hypothetical protein HMPREF9166_1779 [Selenomonas sp. oral taxon 149 str. 67H29BP]|nr:hypothetical protein HMPREF9166_1779 [Selenomonas sp. oral taxon 149 str. 67H29BP]
MLTGKYDEKTGHTGSIGRKSPWMPYVPLILSWIVRSQVIDAA